VPSQGGARGTSCACCFPTCWPWRIPRFAPRAPPCDGTRDVCFACLRGAD